MHSARRRRGRLTVGTRELDRVDIDHEFAAQLESAEAKARAEAYERQLDLERRDWLAMLAQWQAENERELVERERARIAAAAQAEAARVAALAATQRRITRTVLPPAAVAWVLCLLCAVAALAGWP